MKASLLTLAALLVSLITSTGNASNLANNDVTNSPDSFQLACHLASNTDVIFMLFQDGRVWVANFKTNKGGFGKLWSDPQPVDKEILNVKTSLLVLDFKDADSLFGDPRMKSMYMVMQPASQNQKIDYQSKFVYDLVDSKSPAKLGELACRVSGNYGE